MPTLIMLAFQWLVTKAIGREANAGEALAFIAFVIILAVLGNG